MLTQITVVIISCYIHISNHYGVHLKLILYVNYLSLKLKKKKKSKPLGCSKGKEKNYFYSFNEMAKMIVAKVPVTWPQEEK